MKFIASRTSGDPEERLCDEAIWEYNSQEHREVWTIEIKDLKQLCEFTKKHGGSVVLTTDDDITFLPEIEIYDDYRE